jgi:hypothetical protein
MRSMVEGFFGPGKSPFTSLRLVPLPGKCRGGFFRAAYAARHQYYIAGPPLTERTPDT